uniref:Cytochrome P450 9Z4 n=1 Tax=Propylea japonica TaxID=158624 RepID=A0A9E7V382_9CUCU|nr:cytochrome P450 9Z4 [Propylea japonica]
MKAMFAFISTNADHFVNYFLEKDEDIVEVEFKDAMSRFTNDAIASTAYGVQVDSLRDRDNTFYQMGRKGSNFTGIKTLFVILFYQFAPRLAAFLRIPLIDFKVQDFFTNLVGDSIEMRKTENLKRNDVIGILLDTQKGELKSEKDTEIEEAGFAAVEEHLKGKEIKRDLSLFDIAAQTFLFFIAGFEGVSNLLCYVSYELALHPDIQQRLIEEIDENCSDDKTASYTKIMNMTYLDMVISETLRKWPFALATDREITKKYVLKPELPGEEAVTLEPGSVLLIAIGAIQRDPKYFPDPEKFDPERFSPENRKNINPYAYIPFGIGPRNCIGSRFALMEVKALIFKILCHFEIVPTKKTQIPLIMNRKAFGFIPIDGFHLGLKKRNI